MILKFQKPKKSLEKAFRDMLWIVSLKLDLIQLMQSAHFETDIKSIEEFISHECKKVDRFEGVLQNQEDSESYLDIESKLGAFLKVLKQVMRRFVEKGQEAMMWSHCRCRERSQRRRKSRRCS